MESSLGWFIINFAGKKQFNPGKQNMSASAPDTYKHIE
jgi:hypothetical protein